MCALSSGNNPADPRAESLKHLVNKVYDRTKLWAGVGISFQIFLYLAGILAIFEPRVTLKYPPVAFLIALLGLVVATKASKCKGVAERLKREHEYVDGFGKAPSGPRLASLNIDFPKSLRPSFSTLLSEGITYDSSAPYGTTRALENLVESAWFSQHLSKTCARILGGVFISGLSLSIILLVICATDLSGTPAGLAGAQGVTGTLLFLISIGLYRNWTGYQSFSARSEQIDNEACALLSKDMPDQVEALRLMTEYQVARSSAPIIPTWVWRIQRNHLNAQWALHKIR